MKTRFPGAVPAVAWLLFVVLLAPALRGEDADLARLRSKAEKGNVVAQYNLGLAYSEGKTVPRDPVEAYVWLRLAADNGGTGSALGALVHQMSVDELAAGRLRLDERRAALAAVVSGSHAASAAAPSGGPASVAPPAPTEDRFAAMQEELAALRVDKARLSQQLALLQKAPNAAGEPAVSTRTTELTSQLEAARKDLVAASKANEDLTARGKLLLDEQEALKRQLTDGVASAKRLAAVEGQLEETRKELLAVKDSQAEIERSKQDLALLHAQNAALAEANQRLERQNKSDADAPRQRADAQAANEELKRANADLQAQILSLTARLAQAAAAPAASPSSEDLTRLRDELNRANSKVEMTVRSFALLREENERLKSKVAQSADAGSAAPAVQPKTP